MVDLRLHGILSEHGAVTKVAKICNVSPSTVSGWKRVPRWHVKTIGDALGIPYETIRPDLFAPTQPLSERYREEPSPCR